MDLLGYLREEAGNQKATCREGVHGTERRHAQALLLARLPSPDQAIEGECGSLGNDGSPQEVMRRPCARWHRGRLPE
jgi:hypothetical protein